MRQSPVRTVPGCWSSFSKRTPSRGEVVIFIHILWRSRYARFISVLKKQQMNRTVWAFCVKLSFFTISECASVSFEMGILSPVNKTNKKRLQSFIWDTLLTLEGSKTSKPSIGSKHYSRGKQQKRFWLCSSVCQQNISNHSKNPNDTYRKSSMDECLQMIQFRSEWTRWLPQPTKNNNNAYNLVYFTDFDLKFIVVVAEHPS